MSCAGSWPGDLDGDRRIDADGAVVSAFRSESGCPDAGPAWGGVEPPRAGRPDGAVRRDPGAVSCARGWVPERSEVRGVRSARRMGRRGSSRYLSHRRQRSRPPASGSVRCGRGGRSGSHPRPRRDDTRPDAASEVPANRVRGTPGARGARCPPKPVKCGHLSRWLPCGSGIRSVRAPPPAPVSQGRLTMAAGRAR